MMFAGYEKHFHTDIPERPSGKYAHVVLLRKTESYAVFKTDGELNTARVQTSLHDNRKITRITIFKRKQSTPERLTGRELLRRYEAMADSCKYNESFCGKCADCILYGYAIGDSGSEKSKVYVDTTYSLTSYDESHETMILNAPYEDGTMTRDGATTNRFSEQDHVVPEVYFPSVVTLRDPTMNGLAYLINNLRRTKLYGAQTTRTGHMHNQILAIIFADGEIFSNLRLSQAVYDMIDVQNISANINESIVGAARALVAQDGVVYEFVAEDSLATILTKLDDTMTSEVKLRDFMKQLTQESQSYYGKINPTESAKAAKKSK